jgi:hypothetical protein
VPITYDKPGRTFALIVPPEVLGFTMRLDFVVNGLGDEQFDRMIELMERVNRLMNEAVPLPEPARLGRAITLEEEEP